MNPTFKAGLAAVGMAVSVGLLFSSPASAESVLRVGINLSDVPMPTGQPTHGGTGQRWLGWTIFEGLAHWNLRDTVSAPPPEQPNLAEEFFVRPEDQSKWVFKLRRDVKFHDGSPFNADAVIWNIEKLFDENAPQYDKTQVGATACCMLGLKGWRKIDDYTVELDTGTPDAMAVYRLPFLNMASPTAWKKAGSWAEFAKRPAGTGPYKVEEFVPRERVVLVRNDEHWNPARMPKHDKLIIIPIADHNARTSALLAGDVNFIEVPPPDTIPRLEAAGMRIVKNSYPHVWPYHLKNSGEGTPFDDVRVRQALNLCVDREGIVSLLNGYARPAQGFALPGSRWFGNPTFKIRYDPGEAKRLLREAGYGPDNPVKFTMVISTGGSGQMQPLPMNEYIQQNVKQCNIELDFNVVEWQALRAIRNKGPYDPSNKGLHGVNNSWGTMNPYTAFENLFASWKIAPNGINWGVKDAVVDELMKKVHVTFDLKEQNKVVSQVHTRVVDQAYMLWVVHDINVHAMAPNVTGFEPAISWHQDYTQIRVE